ncbi:MAG: HIT domain-containing protein [Methyloprofundus sp.]|nr:HIT domain-containing protein [Methyloprofundus sp.]
MSFILNATLEKDCIQLGKLQLCRVLLMNDSQFPWLVLVPEKQGITEIHQLAEADQGLLMQESSFVAKQLADIYLADKMNIAALGNMVPQLHIHHVVRYKSDKVWPAPIWGKLDAVPYTVDKLERTVTKIKSALNLV